MKGETMEGHMTPEAARTLISLKLQAANIEVRLEEDETVGATTPQGYSLAIVSLLPRAGSRTRFVLPDVRECNRRFVVCTELDEDGAPVQWVLPEICFVARSPIRHAGGAELDLDLPGRELCGQTIRGGLPFLQERWDPIIQFDDFQSTCPVRIIRNSGTGGS